VTVNLERLASWWCDLNVYHWPFDLKLPVMWERMTLEQRLGATAGAWRVIDTLASAEGHELWRQRYEAGRPCHDERSMDCRAHD
jgi:hypothetical protein